MLANLLQRTFITAFTIFRVHSQYSVHFFFSCENTISDISYWFVLNFFHLKITNNNNRGLSISTAIGKCFWREFEIASQTDERKKNTVMLVKRRWRNGRLMKLMQERAKGQKTESLWYCTNANIMDIFFNLAFFILVFLSFASFYRLRRYCLMLSASTVGDKCEKNGQNAI